MSADYSQIDQPAVDTPYRQNVRRIVPIEIQDAIPRALRRPEDLRQFLSSSSFLPSCDLRISPALAGRAAALLRAHPDLMEDLQWHTAAIAAFLSNIVNFETTTRNVQQRVRKLPQ